MSYLVKQETAPPQGDDDQWTYELALSASDSEMNQVERVVYTLDPIFPNPVRVSKSRATEFRIKFRTWGTFTVKVRIVLSDGSDKVMEYPLQPPPGTDMRGHLELGPGPRPEAMLKLAKRLKEVNAFGEGLRLLKAALDDSTLDKGSKTGVKIIQQLALCTYKNTSVPAAGRLDDALEILKKYEPFIAGKDDAETFGLYGAIYKRKWQVDGQLAHLDRSLLNYTLGYKAGCAMKPDDPGFEFGAFPGINAAFLHDLLASVDATGNAEAAQAHRDEATRIRNEIITNLGPLVKAWVKKHPGQRNWWWDATLIEAYVGLGKFKKAEDVIALVNLKEIKEWEKESTCLQIANLIRLHAQAEQPGITLKGLQDKEGWKVLEKLTENNADAVRRSFVGKVGLGLSGGGFRASLYHIGVLARLAERDVLRHVEVISCVSGGSIIGAHYYLALRKLLQERPDGEIDRDEYLKIVQDVAATFLTGVQKNIRMRVVGSFCSNMRMIFAPDTYSRTERLGELYESEIFRAVRDGEEGADRWLNDLFILPLKKDQQTGEVAVDEEFSPKVHNWRRKAKVPILVLNATTLNTGHMWQFTASWMGEPAEAIDGKIDANDRLRRVYYGEAPPDHQKVRLGQAVAASSCVPGLFDPIVLDKLFDDRTVRLVDGGVHDNQGIQALLEQDCSLLLISDACGQMDTVANPAKGSLGVVFRTNDILQARVRTAQFQDLMARKRAGVIKGAMFVHLKMGLEVDPINPIGYVDRLGNLVPPAAGAPAERTEYQITKEAQRRLAALRTDLDSFTEIEAYALMTSGYRMTELGLRSLDFADDVQDKRDEWRFLAIEDSIRNVANAKPNHKEVLRQLGVGSKLAFKVWSLLKPLKILALVLAVLAFFVIAGLVYLTWNQPLVPKTVGAVVIGLALTALGVAVRAFFGEEVQAVLFYQETFKRIIKGIALAFTGWAITIIHLLIFDWLFLHQGEVHGPGKKADPLP